MKNNSNLKRVFNLIVHKNKIKLIVSFAMVLTISLLDLLEPQITKLILDDGIGNKNITLLIKLVIVYAIINFISAIFEIALSYLFSSIKNKVTVNLKVKLLNHISKLSGKYYSSIKTGNILSTIESDIFMIENFGAELIFTIVISAFTALISLIFLVRLQLDLFLIVLALQLLLTFAQSRITKYISKKTSEIRNDSGNLSNLIQEYVSNIMNVVISSSKKNFFSTYLKKERNLIKKYLKLDIIMSSNNAITQVLMSLITISIYGLGGYKIIKGKMTLGELIAFQQYTGMLIGPCISIVRANTRIGQAKSSVNRVFSIIDEEVDIEVNNKGSKLNKGDTNIIEFNNVSFKYSKESTYILDEINLKFKKGEVTAIVGGSGSGKSTIVNLIYRLWNLDKGIILINGIDIRNINLKSLRNNIHIVTQDLLIFDDTIKNNIKLNNSISDEDILEIIDIVGLNDLIDKLSEVLDTLVGEKGVKISGGQKQRIAIARALINDSDILIFDEATSALDNISQKEIFKNIDKCLKDKIVIVIAHRLTTIREADNIYILENGKVVESGDDKNLLENNGLYKKLVTASD